MNVSIEMIENIEYIIVFHSLGNFIFEYQIFKTYNYFSIINFILGIIYTILPMQDINEKLWPLDHDLAEFTWKEAEDDKIF